MKKLLSIILIVASIVTGVGYERRLYGNAERNAGQIEGRSATITRRLFLSQIWYSRAKSDPVAGTLFIDSAIDLIANYPESAAKLIKSDLLEHAVAAYSSSFSGQDASVVVAVDAEKIMFGDIENPQMGADRVLARKGLDFKVEPGISNVQAINVLLRSSIDFLKNVQGNPLGTDG